MSKDEAGKPRPRFPVKVTCPKCQHTGSAICEEAAASNGPQPASLPHGFYHRMQKNHALPPEIVCDRCGGIVLD